MILDHRDDLSAFRQELRAWLQEKVPENWFDSMNGATEEQSLGFQRMWFKTLETERLATAHWPDYWGGVNLSLEAQGVLYQEMALARAPSIPAYVISLFHLPATLAEFGTDAQKERHINDVREKGVIWCQGFSEPGAGSDLASLKTKAVREGDHYVVNGQKLWSSYAPFASHCLLLVRTSNEGKKQAGISYMILELDTPGVEVRPIVQPDGCEMEFAEIFLDDVKIPVDNMIGQENQGWEIAQATLAAERGVIVFDKVQRWRVELETMLREAQKNSAAWLNDSQKRREFAAMMGKFEGVATLAEDVLKENAAGKLSSITAANTKILYSELVLEMNRWKAGIQGLEGQFRAPQNEIVEITDNPMSDYLRAWRFTISGGANEVLRNMLAQIDLGMPR